ncbi:hypothetical protein GCM10009557_34060 [Virgisporangium ochraceum]|uniref:Guanylate cyclase domain-containing protein n=1 Tax=Virgisporangium ochraceum TaxID=65505 RepID=A0A8J3ZX23_9ACTN|nr:hypothetical protein Voc01_049670 [Virgisporangium ochraceum]
MDAKGYGAADDRRQAAMQRGLADMLRASAAEVGLRRDEWVCQPGGDGELAILPADEGMVTVLDAYVRVLADRLQEYNDDRIENARLRLRMAVHMGVAAPAANGYSGAGVVVVSRLVGCAAARAAQAAAPEASLVVVLSNSIFQNLVAQRHTRLGPKLFRRIQVEVKEYRDEAWLYVPGHDVHALDLTTPPAGPPTGSTPSAPKPAPTPKPPPAREQAPAREPANRPGPPPARFQQTNVFEDQVTADVIGIKQEYFSG